MSGHRRREKPARFTGDLRYMWNGELSIKKLINVEFSEIIFRVGLIRDKGVEEFQLNIKEEN